MKTYVFDIDGTICSNTFGEYKLAKPYEERITFINRLFKEGNTIKYFTARGSATGIDWYELTKKQLLEWGALHHELILNKPEGDIYVDDKAVNSEKWLFPPENPEKISSNSSKDLFIKDTIYNQIKTLELILENKKISYQLHEVAFKVKNSIENDGKIIFAGNGGSFSDSQHLAAEFVSRFISDRKPLPAVALGTNSSNLTAIGNDYGFENIFSRELTAIGKKEDFLIALSTSGNSQNIINLVDQAKSMNIPFYILSGKTGGILSRHGDLVIKIPSQDTAIIQQIHILIGHIICKNAELPYLI